MSKLEELIREMCPNGVEYKAFGEIAKIVRGASPRPIKSFITDDPNGIHWIKIGDVLPGSKYITETKERITEAGAKKSRRVKAGDFILSNSMSFGRPYILKIDGCIHDGWLSISEFEHYAISDYLYYVLTSSVVQKEMKRKASFGGAVQNLNADIVRMIQIPVPPLPVQCEIVRILDNFIELTEKLTEELTARKKQCAYYRDKLLNFESNIKFRQTDGNCISQLEKLIREICPNGVEYKTLGEIAVNMFRGSGIKRDQVTEEGIPCVRYGEIYTTYGIWFDQCVSHTQLNYVSSPKYFEHGDILFAVTGESVEDIAKSCAYMGNEKCLAGGDIVVLKHEQNPKYLSYALATTDAKMQKSKGKVKSKVVHASLPSLKQIKIPVPPFPVQYEIVRILDNFEELTTRITAELTARKKQYEYYRDKLLSFPKRKQ